MGHPLPFSGRSNENKAMVALQDLESLEKQTSSKYLVFMNTKY